MHIVHNCSTARAYMSRGRYAVPSMCSFEYQNEIAKNSKDNQMWRPFRYGNKKNQIYQNIYANEIPSLQKICLRLLQKYIIRTAEVSWYIFESQSPYNQTAMCEAIDYLTNHVVRKCPPVYLDEICSTIIDCIEYLITNGYLVQRFISVLFHANLRKLDLNGRPKELQRAMYCRLDGLTQLELLNIERNRHESDFYHYPIEILVLRGVKKMTNLETFIFHDKCTDSIVIAAAQHCPKLRSINVFASEKVTNACTKYLARCQSLLEINLSETSVTRDGFTNVLLGCPQLSRIGTFKQIWDSVSKVRKKEKKLSITKIKEALDCNRNLSAIESCPNLTYLHVDCANYDGQILKIECLRNLEELMIDKGDFWKHGIKDYLEVRGETLEKLTLRDCTNIDMEHIGKACPNLKSLECQKVPIRSKSNTWRKTPGTFGSIQKIFLNLMDASLGIPRRIFKHWKDVVLLLVIFLIVVALTVSLIWLGTF